MATTISGLSRSGSDAIAGDQCVAMHGLDWKAYRTMLRLRGERPAPKMVYLDGSLELVSPSYPHERLAIRLGQFVMEVVVGLDIPCIPTGRTTLRRKERRGGVEGDETFYLANATRVLGVDQIDLRRVPPPDLAIEAVHTHGARAALEVYRRLGVPEVWVCDGEALRIFVRQADGAYARSESSVVLPFLGAAEIHEWVARPRIASETEWVKGLRDWVRDTLAPRRAGP